jgi:hypothetical protein
VGEDSDGGGRGLLDSTNPSYALKDLRKLRRTSVSRDRNVTYGHESQTGLDAKTDRLTG